MESFTPSEAPNLLGALRHCFFSADKSKMVNCVSASASAQHIEAPLTQIMPLLIAEAGFIVNIIFLTWN